MTSTQGGKMRRAELLASYDVISKLLGRMDRQLKFCNKPTVLADYVYDVYDKKNSFAA